jgi:hypothetical protein
MKKILSLSVAAALAMGFAACSSEDVQSPATPQNSMGAYAQVTFTIPSSTSREAQDYTADGAESSDVYSIGSDAEYHINQIYLYFFEENGTPVAVSGTKNYVCWPVNLVANASTSTAEHDNNATGDDGSANKGKVYQSVINRLPDALATGQTYHVYALCNKPCDDADAVTEAKLLESQQTYNATDITDENGNLPMTARSYNGEVYCKLKAETTNTITNPAKLNYEVERSYARVAFMNDDFEFDLLKSNSSDEVIGKVELLQYQLINKNKTFYTYRHVGSLEGATSGYTPKFADYDLEDATEGTDKYMAPTQTRFGRMTDDYNYVIEPTTKSKLNGGTLFNDFINPLAEVNASEGFNTLLSTTDDGGPSIEYIAENTMEINAQKKYQTTGIIFKAKIKPDGYADSQSKYRDGDSFYYYDGKFYKDPANVFAGATSANFKDYGLRYFKEGIGYYEYYIRHLNNGDNNIMGIMEFAIVRNNSYELKVNAIAMSPFSNLPGDEPPTDDEPWDDDTPNGDENDEGAKMYMQVNVTVRPWIVRTNEMTLGH